jgi:hypothetical protein
LLPCLGQTFRTRVSALLLLRRRRRHGGWDGDVHVCMMYFLGLRRSFVALEWV